MAVVFGWRLIVDSRYRERHDTSRFEGIIDPLDRLWFRGPATRHARDDNWKRVGWMTVGMGAMGLIGVVVYLIAE